MDVLNPELKDLRQKFEDIRNSLSKLEGEVELLKTANRDNSRQTIWQFVIFTVTMAVILIGGIKYQSDTLRNEMEIRFEAQRREMSARFDSMEKRFEDLKQEVRAGRK
jgi:hypothetical protein